MFNEQGKPKRVVLIKLGNKSVDVGLIWAKYVNTWGQVGSVAGMVNMLMMLGVFYTTTLRPSLEMPLWLYVVIVIVAAAFAVLFVLKIGISGYYRFFSRQSEVAETNKRVQENSRKLDEQDRKLNLVMSKLGIEDTGKE